jgi:hypothetical protein
MKVMRMRKSATYPNRHNDKHVVILLITSSFPYLGYTQTYATFLHILKTKGSKNWDIELQFTCKFHKAKEQSFT